MAQAASPPTGGGKSYAQATSQTVKKVSVTCQTDITCLSDRDQTVKEMVRVSGGGNKPAETQTKEIGIKASAPGRGNKSAIPQPKQVIVGKSPTSQKPPLQPRPPAGDSSRSGKGGQEAVLVQMAEKSPSASAPTAKPSGPAGGPTSGRQQKGDGKASSTNRFYPLDEVGGEEKMQ
jgi:hypothetical protein